MNLYIDDNEIVDQLGLRFFEEHVDTRLWLRAEKSKKEVKFKVSIYINGDSSQAIDFSLTDLFKEEIDSVRFDGLGESSALAYLNYLRELKEKIENIESLL